MSDLERFAAEISAASMEYREQLPKVPAGVYRMSELPDHDLNRNTGYQKLREIGRRLAEMDGDMMTAAYDATIDNYGYRGVRGVDAAWTGIGGWQA